MPTTSSTLPEPVCQHDGPEDCDDRTADALRMAAALALLTDDELDAMTRRAYAGAASAWSELRRWRPAGAMTPDDFRTVRAMLAEDAESLDDWYATLRAEAQRRATPTTSAT